MTSTTGLTGTAAILTAALSQIGVPYSWGGESPGADFDCSGLVQWAYSQAGIQLPRTSQSQYQSVVQIPESQAQPGDLVFMNFGEQGPGPGHVGIYLGGGKFLNAPHTGANVRVDNVPSDAVFGAVSGVTHNASTAGPGVLAQITNTATATLTDFSVPGLGSIPGLGGVEHFAADVLSGKLWTNILLGALGVVLFVAGLVIFFQAHNPSQAIVSDAIG